MAPPSSRLTRAPLRVRATHVVPSGRSPPEPGNPSGGFVAQVLLSCSPRGLHGDRDRTLCHTLSIARREHETFVQEVEWSATRLVPFEPMRINSLLNPDY